MKKEKSPETPSHCVLGVASITRIRSFLEDSVNLPNPIDYPEHVPHFERWLARWQSEFGYSVDSVSRSAPREALALLAPILRTILRRLWAETDERQRTWYCFRLRDAGRGMIRRLEGWDGWYDCEQDWVSVRTVQKLTDEALLDVPALTLFEVAVYWAQLNAKAMLVCANPGCPAPYFFRAEKGQTHCSATCGDEARREAKRQWWRKNRGASRKLHC